MDRLQLQRIQDRSGLRLLEPKYSSRRVLYLPPFAIEKLREHQDRQNDEREVAGERWQENGLMFPNTYGAPMEPRNLQRDFTRLREEIGINELTLHGLRHSATSLYLAMGIQPHVVQAIMGHANPNITLAIYAHVQNDDLRKAARLMQSTLLSGSP